MLPYLTENIILAGLFALFYRLVLAREKSFLFNRIFLLFSVLASGILPLFPWTDVLEVSTSVSFTEPVMSLGMDVQKTLQRTGTQNLALQAFYVCYFGTLLFFLIRLSIRIWHIFDLAYRFRHDSKQNGPVRIIYTKDKASTFSFLNLIFWNSSKELEPSAEAIIMKHEMAHIHQKHSYDILFTEFLCVILWINPFFWLIKKYIRSNHEFLADQEVLTQNKWSDYADLLVRQLFHNMHYDLGNFFNKSITLRRVKMMENSSPIKKWKHWALVPFLIATILSMATIEKVTANSKRAFQVLVPQNSQISREYSVKDFDSKAVISELRKEGLVVKKININHSSGKLHLTLSEGQWR